MEGFNILVVLFCFFYCVFFVSFSRPPLLLCHVIRASYMLTRVGQDADLYTLVTKNTHAHTQKERKQAP